MVLTKEAAVASTRADSTKVDLTKVVKDSINSIKTTQVTNHQTKRLNSTKSKRYTSTF